MEYESLLMTPKDPLKAQLTGVEDTFPFKCGKAMVYGDYLTVRSGLLKKKTVDISFEEIIDISYANSECWIAVKKKCLIRIGSANRESRERLMLLWRKYHIEMIKKQGYLDGEVSDSKRGDKIVGFMFPFITIFAIHMMFDPFSFRWSRMEGADLLILSIVTSGFILYFGGPMIFFWRQLWLINFWKGPWRIDREGFWRQQKGGMQSIVRVEAGDGVCYPSIRYGGKSLPVSLLKSGEMFRDLLAIHLGRYNTTFSVEPLWPRFARSLIVPALLAGWWFARLRVGFPVQQREMTSLLIAGSCGFLFLVIFAFYDWRTQKKELDRLQERVEQLRNDLNW